MTPAPKITNDEAASGSGEINKKEQCKPKKKIVFLKTHKTGSSTITNILNRYADWHNLTMLLPSGEGYYSFDWPNKFRLNSARNLHGLVPDILANHARYSRKSMNVLFPRSNTTYITILREPVSQWESTFNYMSFPYILNILNLDDPLDFFLNNLPSLGNIFENARRFPSLYLIKNPLFFDLGLDYRYYDNKTMIRRAINTIEKDFNMVLMMEHFDESMTLLRRRLCWSIDDVVYFKSNERLNKNKRRVLTDEQRETIRQWNNADVALYEYFNEKFWQQIAEEGPDFYDEVQELKARRKYYHKLCIEKETVTEAYTSVFVKGFSIRTNLTGRDKLFCQRMLRNELQYQDYYKQKYNKWIDRVEGVTIENFDENLDETNVTIPEGNTYGDEITSYDYGRPFKRPFQMGSRNRGKRKIKRILKKVRSKLPRKPLSDSKTRALRGKFKVINDAEGSAELDQSKMVHVGSLRRAAPLFTGNDNKHVETELAGDSIQRSPWQDEIAKSVKELDGDHNAQISQIFTTVTPDTVLTTTALPPESTTSSPVGSWTSQTNAEDDYDRNFKNNRNLAATTVTPDYAESFAKINRELKISSDHPNYVQFGSEEDQSRNMRPDEELSIDDPARYDGKTIIKRRKQTYT